MSIISSSAVIDPHASLAMGVVVGHFSVIEKDVIIGENSNIAESVVITAGCPYRQGCDYPSTCCYQFRDQYW